MRRKMTGTPFEALTSPALLSPRERREKGKEKELLVPLSPSGREGPGE
jgi:hypothetical protein